MNIDLNKKKVLISKSAILSQHNELEIFQRYIDKEINIGGKPIISPLRKEKNASFGFFVGENNEICFNDFKLGKGDFIQFLRLKYDLTYFEALSKVACDFDMQDDYICKKSDKEIFTKNNNNVTKKELLTNYTGYNLNKRARKWMAHDVLFWNQYGIGKKTLDFFKVEPIDYIFIGDNCHSADKYAYCFIEVKDGIETYKIYQPYNEKYKWINNHNNSVWQGWTQLPEKGEDLIITKSLKDVMCIYEITGIPAVSMQSENVLPKGHVFNQLNERFTYISLLYDNDFDSEINWGREFADKFAKEFGLIDCFIKDEYKCKDFSDLVKMYGKEKAKNILLKETLIPF
jgi:hypothetical protein